MENRKINFEFEVYDSLSDLSDEDAALFKEAKNISKLAYAPYSQFKVGALARLTNGNVIAGSNQENASYPVGICAERVLLSTASSVYPGIPIDCIAITYRNDLGKSNRPITPCGICRQSLVEYASRMNHPIRLILGGMEGKIFIIPNVEMLLPLGFSGADMK